MTNTTPPTLLDQWKSSLANHRLVAIALLAIAVVVGMANFTEAVTKLKNWVSPSPPTPPSVIVNVPSPADLQRPVVPTVAAPAPSSCLEPSELALREADLGNATALLERGEKLLVEELPSVLLYEKVKLWEDEVAQAVGKRDAFIYFEYWRTQIRDKSTAQNKQLVLLQLERNVSAMRKIKMSFVTIVAEAKSIVCK